MACSNSSVILFGWNSGSDIVVPVHAVSDSGSEENTVLNGSSEW